MELTLEQEFMARAFFHKSTILGGYVMNKYINDEKAKGGITLPDPILMEQAEKISEQVVQESLRDGTFNQLYETAWKDISDRMPEYLKLL